MVLECSCGRSFRVADGAPAVRRDCPECGSILRDAATGVAMEDVRVLKGKERALRDALRQRDRQLRQARVRIVSLTQELERFRGTETPTSPVPAAPPGASTPWQPVELPSDRLNLNFWSAPPFVVIERGLPTLPSDRIPLFPPEQDSGGTVPDPPAGG
jgi:hypothetical protein